ncbi:lipoprotein [Massilia sp. Dwa41.01b]|uniref:LPS translocon maturation chaperone LptM n=1 Tax=Massilia sp. Dwa41.01b TaxID=2709302 RepID=UPI001E64E3DA|nr:lipoprotein [Massilia sp. Dwa41.01b]
MKSPIALSFASALALVLAGCGQTGPLYMPKPPARAGAPTPPAAQTPAPAPAKPVTPNPVPASTQ